jgi:hypothetical protein
MKKHFKKLVTSAVANDAVWAFFEKQVIPLVEYAKRKRRTKEQLVIENTDEVLRRISPSKEVLYGPFKGLTYPEFRSFGSSLVNKILGCYEMELHPLFERLKQKNYSAIVDIGSAEGYYANGLARMFPTAKIFAFDTNFEALDFCRQMASFNGVEDRLQTGAFCSTETLLNLNLGNKALIVSDCEGFEKELFTKQLVDSLSGHDVLVEVHDYIDIEISTNLRRVFSKTHDIISIQSIDDIQKALTYDYSELEGFCLADRKMLLAEYRPSIMEWFFFSPRINLQPLK